MAEVAYFLIGLQNADAVGGPAPGPHNFYRGGHIRVYDQETRQAVRELGRWIDADAATAVWEAACDGARRASAQSSTLDVGG